MKLTALGSFIGIVPVFSAARTAPEAWLVVSFDGNCHWTSIGKHTTEAEAKRERARIFKHHRKIADERAARRRIRN